MDVTSTLVPILCLCRYYTCVPWRDLPVSCGWCYLSGPSLLRSAFEGPQFYAFPRFGESAWRRYKATLIWLPTSSDSPRVSSGRSGIPPLFLRARPSLGNYHGTMIGKRTGKALWHAARIRIDSFPRQLTAFFAASVAWPLLVFPPVLAFAGVGPDIPLPLWRFHEDSPQDGPHTQPSWQMSSVLISLPCVTYKQGQVHEVCVFTCSTQSSAFPASFHNPTISAVSFAVMYFWQHLPPTALLFIFCFAGLIQTHYLLKNSLLSKTQVQTSAILFKQDTNFMPIKDIAFRACRFLQSFPQQIFSWPGAFWDMVCWFLFLDIFNIRFLTYTVSLILQWGIADFYYDCF